MSGTGVGVVLGAVSLGAYEISPDAFVLTDSRGRLRMVNEAAGDLLECNPRNSVGRRCWNVVGLHTRDGAPICRSDCRVRRRLASNAPCARQRVVRTTKSGSTQELDVFTLKVEPTSRSWAVLHMIVPVEAASSTTPDLPAPNPAGVRGLRELTRREKEVLRALAAGESTDGIADELFISVTTVRNHIRSILRKLRVNNRLEAVLIWVSQFR